MLVTPGIACRAPAEHLGGNSCRFTLKIGFASILAAAAMVGASLALGLYGLFDRTQLLIRTPVAGFIGLGILAAVMFLVSRQEIVSWRAILRRRPRPDLPVRIEAAPPVSADVMSIVEDGVDVEAVADVESTAITTNLP